MLPFDFVFICDTFIASTGVPKTVKHLTGGNGIGKLERRVCTREFVVDTYIRISIPLKGKAKSDSK